MKHSCDCSSVYIYDIWYLNISISKYIDIMHYYHSLLPVTNLALTSPESSNWSEGAITIDICAMFK